MFTLLNILINVHSQILSDWYLFEGFIVYMRFDILAMDYYVPICISSHLLTLILSLLLSKYDFSLLRSLLILFSRVEWSSGLQISSIYVSLANKLVVHVSMTADRSFKNKRKNNVPCKMWSLWSSHCYRQGIREESTEKFFDGMGNLNK